MEEESSEEQTQAQIEEGENANLARSLASSKEAVEVLGAALAGPLASALRAQGLIPSGSAAMGPPFGAPSPCNQFLITSWL